VCVASEGNWELCTRDNVFAYEVAEVTNKLVVFTLTVKLIGDSGEGFEQADIVVWGNLNHQGERPQHPRQGTSGILVNLDFGYHRAMVHRIERHRNHLMATYQGGDKNISK
jgi:hypothetical protein